MELLCSCPSLWIKSLRVDVRIRYSLNHADSKPGKWKRNASYPPGPCFHLHSANEAEVIAFSYRSCLGNIYKILKSCCIEEPHLRTTTWIPWQSVGWKHYLSETFKRRKEVVKPILTALLWASESTPAELQKWFSVEGNGFTFNTKKLKIQSNLLSGCTKSSQFFFLVADSGLKFPKATELIWFLKLWCCWKNFFLRCCLWWWESEIDTRDKESYNILVGRDF